MLNAGWSKITISQVKTPLGEIDQVFCRVTEVLSDEVRPRTVYKKCHKTNKHDISKPHYPTIFEKIIKKNIYIDRLPV